MSVAYRSNTPTQQAPTNSNVLVANKFGSTVEDYYSSGGFAATDIVVVVQAKPEYGITSDIVLGTLAMLSVSTHRDKFPVSAFNRVGAKGFTAGHRTIAGTLAFNTIDREAFTKITDAARQHWSIPDVLHADELPWLDIVITCVNEHGLASYSTLNGVTILDEGVTYGLENVTLMESYSYMAKDRTPLQPAALKAPKTDKKSENGLWAGTNYSNFDSMRYYSTKPQTLRVG